LFDETPRSPAQIAAWDRVAAHFATAGRLDLAEPLWDALDSVADRFDSPWIHRARALRGLFHGDPATYAIHSAAAADAFERNADLRNACQQRCNAGDAIKELGDHRVAVEMLEKSLVEAERMGLAYVTTNAKLNLSVVLMRTGEGARAVELATAAAAEGKGQHHPRFEGAAWTYLAMAYQCAGDLGSAIREATRAAEFIRASVPPWLPFALAARASIELALGDEDAALASAREGMDRLSALGSVEEGEALVRLMFAEVLEENGDRKGACEAILEARKALLERAERITDARYRKSFLENIREHARTLELAHLWGDQPSQPTT
jgi:tetratricopeptide (TPR) repeat protein